jgi:DinB superfamily
VKRIIFMTTTALLAAGALCAQTPAERQKAVKYLEQTRDGVVAATKGLSDAQMHFKAGPDRWSVAETLEHIAKAEQFLLQNTADNVMTKAPAPPAGRDTAKIDGFVLAAIPDRSHKAQAPEPLVPSSKTTPAQSLDEFLKGRAKTVAFVESTQGMREHAIDSPLGQPLDAYEWVLFIAAHSERHTKQILEVKADPGFPKK